MIIENGIGHSPRLFTQDFCQDAIRHFEKLLADGFGKNRQQEGAPRHSKHDDAVWLSEMDLKGTHIAAPFFSALWSQAWPQYVENFSVLQGVPAVSVFEIKMQKTPVGGGFHSWHFEADSRERANRLAAYTVYLNDVTEGGETEFLYLGKRYKPAMGDMLLFPAGYTHAHRGNPPLSGVKYILTGWIVM